MTDEELNEKLDKKWEAVLDYTDEHISELKKEDRSKCAREMEEVQSGEGGSIYKTNLIPIIRQKYSNIPSIIENIDGKEYIVTEQMVTECIYEDTPKGECPKWKSVDRKVKWYFPILDDKSDESYGHLQNIHVFGRGYTDGIYHNTPKWGSSVIQKRW